MTAIYRNWFDLGNICDGRPNQPEKRTKKNSGKRYARYTCMMKKRQRARGRQRANKKESKPQHICLAMEEQKMQHGSALKIIHYIFWMQREPTANSAINAKDLSSHRHTHNMPSWHCQPEKSQNFYRFYDFIYSFASLIFHASIFVADFFSLSLPPSACVCVCRSITSKSLVCAHITIICINFLLSHELFAS